MAKKSELLTSSEFSSKAGISASTVSKLIRDGKIKAVKKSGKWMIDPGQLKAKAIIKATKKSKPSAQKKPAKSAPQKVTAKSKKSSAPKAATPALAQKTFTVAEFAEMTYLTEKGVNEWLKTGLLSGQQDDKGTWQIDSANLDAPNVKRLIRDS
ncbi:MAG: helix-turn-helix domain-containing protein [Deltaproteobacteria bacterium]|jgi:predicted site-specific integrase-resolvase|nr:helix-turn-helix domain-containing protein [Deltaproteobacteria bacterium]